MDHFKFNQIQSHSEEIPPNCNDYFFIMNVHNPYKRIVSLFEMIKKGERYGAIIFEEWIKKIVHEFQKNNTNPNQIQLSKIFHNFEKKPDHFVRVENLYEDLLKIKFIEDKFNPELEQIFTEYILKNNYGERENDFWKNKYDKNLSDLVFDNFKNDFELFGYDKNSWK